MGRKSQACGAMIVRLQVRILRKVTCGFPFYFFCVLVYIFTKLFQKPYDLVKFTVGATFMKELSKTMLKFA